jgi:hypothetical protein
METTLTQDITAPAREEALVYHPSEILAAWNVDVVGDLRL